MKLRPSSNQLQNNTACSEAEFALNHVFNFDWFSSMNAVGFALPYDDNFAAELFGD